MWGFYQPGTGWQVNFEAHTVCTFKSALHLMGQGLFPIIYLSYKQPCIPVRCKLSSSSMVIGSHIPKPVHGRVLMGLSFFNLPTWIWHCEMCDCTKLHPFCFQEYVVHDDNLKMYWNDVHITGWIELFETRPSTLLSCRQWHILLQSSC